MSIIRVLVLITVMIITFFLSKLIFYIVGLVMMIVDGRVLILGVFKFFSDIMFYKINVINIFC